MDKQIKMIEETELRLTKLTEKEDVIRFYMFSHLPFSKWKHFDILNFFPAQHIPKNGKFCFVRVSRITKKNF